MDVICAWCGKSMGTKPPYGGLNNEYTQQTTTGICETCMCGLDTDLREQQRLIDQPNIPYGDEYNIRR